MKNTNVEVVEADETMMSFPDDLFSATLSFAMLHHVPSVTPQDAPGRELGCAAQAVRELTTLAVREK